MYKLIPSFLKKKHQRSGCIVIIGNDIAGLSQIIGSHIQHDAMLVYSVQHDLTQTNMQIESQDAELKVVRLNLLNPTALKNLVNHIQRTGYFIDLCIFQADVVSRLQQVQHSAQSIEQLWQNTGLTAVNISQAMIRHMLSQRQGTLIFLGSQLSSDITNHLESQSMLASIRALSQSLAREFHPKGIHISYCMLEHWDSQNAALMDSVKNICWHLYQQPKSTWSQELSIASLMKTA
jgi:short-subunit dehydrogenase